jgi:hypothetical protein
VIRAIFSKVMWVGRSTSAVVALAVMLALWLMVGCSGSGGADGQGGDKEQASEETITQQQTTTAKASHEVFVGGLTDEVMLVGLDVDEADQAGSRAVKAYICDGLGPPLGTAVWFKGSANGGTASMTSPGGQEKLDLALGDQEASGTYTDADGASHPFTAPTAFLGAGIYNVTIDENYRYTGTSTDGSSLDAKIDWNAQSPSGNQNEEAVAVEGTITTTDGEKIDFRNYALPFFSPEALREAGMPTTYSQFQDTSLRPDEYIAVVSPGGLYWFGRSGDVKGGNPRAEIIGLDKFTHSLPDGFSASFDRSAVQQSLGTSLR